MGELHGSILQGLQGKREARGPGDGETRKKGNKLHFKSPTAERRHVLWVGVGGDRTHAGPLQKSRVCPP